MTRQRWCLIRALSCLHHAWHNSEQVAGEPLIRGPPHTSGRRGTPQRRAVVEGHTGEPSSGGCVLVLSLTPCEAARRLGAIAPTGQRTPESNFTVRVVNSRSWTSNEIGYAVGMGAPEVFVGVSV
jgi:hypothetical protein